jgi:hypothetical protein
VSRTGLFQTIFSSTANGRAHRHHPELPSHAASEPTASGRCQFASRASFREQPLSIAPRLWPDLRRLCSLTTKTLSLGPARHVSPASSPSPGRGRHDVSLAGLEMNDVVVCAAFPGRLHCFWHGASGRLEPRGAALVRPPRPSLLCDRSLLLFSAAPSGVTALWSLPSARPSACRTAVPNGDKRAPGPSPRISAVRSGEQG